jgi:oligoendopeptidase F
VPRSSRYKIGSWQISDLVKDAAGNEFSRFLEDIQKKVKEIEYMRKDLSDSISPALFQAMLRSIEDVQENVNIATGYAHLQFAANTSSNEAASLLTKMQIMSSDITNRLLFFDLWFKKEITEETASRLIESMPYDYTQYFKHKRLLAKHTLSEPEEKIISTLEVTGTNALVKIYDRMTSAFEFLMRVKKGRKIAEKFFSNKEKMISFTRSTRPEEREAAYKALWQTYKKNSGVLGEIYQNRVIQWHDEYLSMRAFNSPISVRNIYNNLDDQTVETLLEVCRRNSKLFQEYFNQKAKILGLKKLRRYDLYAPLKLKKRDEEKNFSYTNAVHTVLESFGEFDMRFRGFAERVFNEDHVDSEIRDNKQGGAFCSTITPRITPYILLNFNGKSRDVSTMAHELGHAIHSISASTKPITVSHPQLPLAETASVFAEMLLNDKLLKKISEQERKLMLAQEIDDMYATIMRQAYFTVFEIAAHKAIVQQNVTVEDLAALYMKILNEQFGDSVKVSEDFQWEWLYIPHFYHTPFYCYSYSFGNLLVLSLYNQFKSETKDSFISKYMKILSAGGSRKPEELLRESGINISNDEFWQQGFDLVSNKIQLLKEMN